jgi:voltage-gated potassium channel
VSRVLLLERQVARFLRKPVTVRSAAGAIVSTTAVIVIASGLLMRVLDHREYPNIFIGMWWAIQTVTTVGYGDVTPKAVGGRIVAALVMLEGIAFIAIVTAAITSTFVARAEHLQDVAAAQDDAARETDIQAGFADVTERLDRVETMLHRLTRADPAP